MEGLVKHIMDDIANDPLVDASKINVEERKVGSVFKKKTVVHIFGSVGSNEARAKVERITREVVGPEMEIQNDLKIKGKALA